jgi:hypothetical protein
MLGVQFNLILFVGVIFIFKALQQVYNSIWGSNLNSLDSMHMILISKINFQQVCNSMCGGIKPKFHK